MMMCISGVSDFEAQIDRSADRFMRGRSAEEAELVTRSWDWLYARQYVDGSFDRLAPAAVEPSRPYSNGRRFIPAWLAAERERCMAMDCGTVLYLRDGYVVLRNVRPCFNGADTSVIVGRYGALR